MQHLFKINTLNKSQIQEILDLSLKLEKEPKNILKGKNILFAFEKPSLRTKISTEAAINHLGGNVIHVDPKNFFGLREDLKDTVKNISQWCDAIFARVFLHKTIENIVELSDIPVINALCDEHHPMQALADLLTIQQKFGNQQKVICAFVGDANNVAFSLIEILLKFGHVARFAGPPKYSFSEEQIEYFQNLAQENKGETMFTNDPIEAAAEADIVYTDTFISMGEEKKGEEKIKHFTNYQIDQKLLSHANKKVGFMHCLPAHRGIEVLDEVMDSPSSWIYDQARNRMVTAKGVFAKLLE